MFTVHAVRGNHTESTFSFVTADSAVSLFNAIATDAHPFVMVRIVWNGTDILPERWERGKGRVYG